jgi:hypothetical protein
MHAVAYGYEADMTRSGWCCVLVVSFACLTGCAASASPAETVATRFTVAVSGSQWSRACHLLTPRTRSELEKSAGSTCSKALAEEKLPHAGAVRSSARFGTMAQVRFRGDTVFVARFGEAWRVSAAGCRRVSGHPYDCTLEG